MEHLWAVEDIAPATMIKDAAGSTLNGSCYKVTLRKDTRNCAITLVITRWAESEAEAREPGLTLEELARNYVREELARGWDPERYRWLTVDSESVGVVLDRMPGAEQELASAGQMR
jgi:hypothetical protein